MKHVQKILVPTDLSEQSRRGLRYACSLAADEKATLVVLHVANEFQAWEFLADDFAFSSAARTWPIDRVLVEASLELHRFLEPHLDSMKNISRMTKRVILGPIAQQIVFIAEAEKADLIVMSPRRERRLRYLLTGSITDRVMRMSPCPVLSIGPPLPSRLWRGKLWRTRFGAAKEQLAVQS